MPEDSPKPPSKVEPAFVSQVRAKAARKLRARSSTQGIWFGLGMMGLIGWSVVVPTLLGAALGLWLDRHHPGRLSWTLALLVGGLAVGCLNAWHWVDKEHKAMREDSEKGEGGEMKDVLRLVWVGAAGAGLGVIFYGGLWWTIRRALRAPWPAPWLLGSLVVRMGLALGGLALLSGGEWPRWVIALLGFIMARAGVVWWTRPRRVRRIPGFTETLHAP